MANSYRYLWIRIALYEKKLARIIDHLVSNAIRYYDKDSLVADPDYGSILSSLLVGPCALDYSRAKTHDHFWTDPSANDLVQRNIIPTQPTTPQAPRRPMLNIKRMHTSSDDSGISSYKSNSPASTAKDYVESLHQNSRTTLLYGKNNVLVHHVSGLMMLHLPHRFSRLLVFFCVISERRGRTNARLLIASSNNSISHHQVDTKSTDERL